MIEGIFREPLEREIIAHRQVLALEQIAIDDLEAFVSVYQPNAQLRAGPGMNVTVGAHRPPPGGISIVYRLDDLLTQVNSEIIDPWTAHVRYARASGSVRSHFLDIPCSTARIGTPSALVT